jgi:hypothetical protein
MISNHTKTSVIADLEFIKINFSEFWSRLPSLTDKALSLIKIYNLEKAYNIGDQLNETTQLDV